MQTNSIDLHSNNNKTLSKTLIRILSALKRPVRSLTWRLTFRGLRTWKRVDRRKIRSLTLSWWRHSSSSPKITRNWRRQLIPPRDSMWTTEGYCLKMAGGTRVLKLLCLHILMNAKACLSHEAPSSLMSSLSVNSKLIRRRWRRNLRIRTWIIHTSFHASNSSSSVAPAPNVPSKERAPSFSNQTKSLKSSEQEVVMSLRWASLAKSDPSMIKVCLWAWALTEKYLTMIQLWQSRHNQQTRT